VVSWDTEERRALRASTTPSTLHGGLGYMRESEVERHYRDVRLLPIGGGSTEVLTDLAARLLGYSS
jgi:alkylation response protein AidB-like acyl-CoA dehydrogenase